MIVELGVQSAVSQRNLGIQGVISTQVDAARESVAGVNLDEEMTNMLSFQHAYSAAGADGHRDRRDARRADQPHRSRGAVI